MIEALIVIIRILRVCQVKDYGGIRSTSSTIGVWAREIDRAVEVERAICIEINVEDFEVGWSIDKSSLARLDEIIHNDKMFLIGYDLDIV